MLGVVYQLHSAIDDFISDFDPILQTINEEKTKCYITGDFNIDLLKDDVDRPTHYLDLIYSHSAIPTILKPTRITKTSATIIDNIITNSDNPLRTAILITDISDHLPSILMTKLKTGNDSGKSESSNENKLLRKQKFTEDDFTKVKQRLSQVKWNEVLHGADCNHDYNNNELIPLTAHNWQKWKRVFLTCPCHEIYRVEAVGLKNCNYI